VKEDTHLVAARLYRRWRSPAARLTQFARIRATSIVQLSDKHRNVNAIIVTYTTIHARVLNENVVSKISPFILPGSIN